MIGRRIQSTLSSKVNQPGMSWRHILLAIIVSLTIAAGAIAEEGVITLVTLGDSITKGVRAGVEDDQTFSSLVEGDLIANGVHVKVLNMGVGGERTDQALERLDAVVALDPDHTRGNRRNLSRGGGGSLRAGRTDLDGGAE